MSDQSTHTVITPNGSTQTVPTDQLQDAVANGHKIAAPVKSPDGSVWHIPVDRLHDAVQAGGTLMAFNSPPVDKPSADASQPDSQAPLTKAQAVLSGSSKQKKLGKYDVKPLEGDERPFPVVTADESGKAMNLPTHEEQMVRDLVNSYSVDKVPEGGIVFVPEKKYNELRQQIEGGSVFGKKITQAAGAEEHFGPTSGSITSTHLGDGFTIPQAKRTYLNAALLNDPKQLDKCLLTN